MTNNEFKELAVNVGLKMVMTKIPEGNCPYSYYGNKETVKFCEGFGNTLECGICRSQFYRNMMRQIQDAIAMW